MNTVTGSLSLILASIALLFLASTSLADPPRTEWGTPDLSGNWDFRSITPFERPEYFKDKEFLTAEEVAGFEEAVRKSREDMDGSKGEGEQQDVDVGYNAFFLDLGEKMTGTMRTSLVIDPPDGRVPPVSDTAKQRVAEFRKLQTRAPHGPEDRTPSERCITGFNFGPPMTPGAYNNIMQIVQSQDHVALLVEMVNDHRIIPTSGGEALPGHMKLWKGDSRGVWKGDTFVVTTTNFNDLYMFRYTGPNATLTERFTRLDEDTLEYRFTVDDPDAYERPWTAVMEMVRTDADVYEYACHEGNYAMPLMLKGARRQEREGIEDDTWLPTWYKPRKQ